MPCRRVISRPLGIALPVSAVPFPFGSCRLGETFLVLALDQIGILDTCYRRGPMH